MSEWEDAIFDAAEFMLEWDANGMRMKLYRIPRQALDNESDESDAYLLHGIDGGAVRQIDITIDRAYSRWDKRAQTELDAAMRGAPAAAKIILA